MSIQQTALGCVLRITASTYRPVEHTFCISEAFKFDGTRRCREVIVDTITNRSGLCSQHHRRYLAPHYRSGLYIQHHRKCLPPRGAHLLHRRSEVFQFDGTRRRRPCCRHYRRRVFVFALVHALRGKAPVCVCVCLPTERSEEIQANCVTVHDHGDRDPYKVNAPGH